MTLKNNEDELIKKLDTLLGIAEIFPLIDVLEELIKSADILLHRHDYDAHGWERIEYCVTEGKRYSEIIMSTMEFLHNKNQQ